MRLQRKGILPSWTGTLGSENQALDMYKCVDLMSLFKGKLIRSIDNPPFLNGIIVVSDP